MFTSTGKINHEDKIPLILGSFLLLMGMVISGCSTDTTDELPNNDTELSNQPVQSAQPEQPIQPSQLKMVGRINSFNGPISAYTLKRKGEMIKIGTLVPVYKGDTITIKHQNLMLELFLGGAHSIRVSYEDSPYVVKEMGKVPDKWGNSWQWITTRFEEIWGDDECDPKKRLCEKISVMTPRSQTRGDSMLMPLLQDNPSQMVAGERPLYLRWFCGQSPYQVSINHNGQALTSESVEEQWIKTQVLSLKAGTDNTYKVTITDADGQTMTENFKVVATTIDFPKALQEDTSLSPESRQTIWAMELAAQKQGQWMLEAYQQIAEIADKHYPAWLLRDWLENGLRIEKTK